MLFFLGYITIFFFFFKISQFCPNDRDNSSFAKMSESTPFQSLCIPLSLGSVSMRLAIKDDQIQLCLHLYELNKIDECIIYLNHKEWTLLTSQLLDSYVKLAIEDILSLEHRENIVSTFTSINPASGIMYVPSHLYKHQFRLGPNLNVEVYQCDDAAIISINDFGNDNTLKKNEVDFTVFTWDFIRDQYSKFSSLVTLCK